MWNFSTARKVRPTSRVASQYTSEADLSESLWLDFASHFARALPIPYVKATILNPIYGVATALRDILERKYSLQCIYTVLIRCKIRLPPCIYLPQCISAVCLCMQTQLHEPLTLFFASGGTVRICTCMHIVV